MLRYTFYVTYIIQETALLVPAPLFILGEVHCLYTYDELFEVCLSSAIAPERDSSYNILVVCAVVLLAVDMIFSLPDNHICSICSSIWKYVNEPQISGHQL